MSSRRYVVELTAPQLRAVNSALSLVAEHFRSGDYVDESVGWQANHNAREAVQAVMRRHAITPGQS